MNLTLIGMSGAGKSYIGKKVAERLSLQFIDIDEAIEEDFGAPLPELVVRLGDDAFIEAEKSTTISRTKGKDRLLISTGGSVIYAPEAMEHLKNNSFVVHMDVPFESINQRVGRSADRLGRIVRLGTKTLKQLFDERLPMYKQHAHASVEIGSLSASDAAELIAKLAQEK